MNNSKSYEEGYRSSAFGKIMKQNIVQVTHKAIELCNITSKDQVLALSYGTSDTTRYLKDKYNVKAVDMDYAKRMNVDAKEEVDNSELREELPFETSSFHYVISEFTFNMVTSLNGRVEEMKRVLKKNGCVVIADIFSKNSVTLQILEGKKEHVKEVLPLEEVQKSLAVAGFKNVYMGEYSELLGKSFESIEERNSLMDKVGLFVLIAFKEAK